MQDQKGRSLRDNSCFVRRQCLTLSWETRAFLSRPAVDSAMQKVLQAESPLCSLPPSPQPDRAQWQGQGRGHKTRLVPSSCPGMLMGFNGYRQEDALNCLAEGCIQAQ